MSKKTNFDATKKRKKEERDADGKLDPEELAQMLNDLPQEQDRIQFSTYCTDRKKSFLYFFFNFAVKAILFSKPSRIDCAKQFGPNSDSKSERESPFRSFYSILVHI